MTAGRASVVPAGPVVAVGPLMGSQEFLWFCYHTVPPDTRHLLNLVLCELIPDGVPVAAVNAAVDAVVARHEALRTTYVTAEDGRPRQVVHSPGHVELEVRDVSLSCDLTDAGQVGALVAPLSQRAIDIGSELPVRPTVVRAGEHRLLVLVCTHLSADALSLSVLRQELRQRWGTERPDRRPVGTDADAAAQPLQQAVAEQALLAGGRGDRALQAAARLYQRVPARVFPPPPAQESTSWHGRLYSRDLAVAAKRLADRCQVWPSALYLSVFAAFLRRISGLPEAVLFVDLANRSRATRRSVGCFFRAALVALAGMPGGTVPDVFGAAHRAMLAEAAHRMSFFTAKEAKARAEADRGIEINICVTYNFTSLPAAEGPEAAPAASTPSLTVQMAESRQNTDMYFRVQSTPHAVELSLLASPAVATAGDVAAVLVAIESLLTELAGSTTWETLGFEELIDRYGVVARPAGNRCVLVDRCWADIDRITDVVRSFPGAGAVAVMVEERSGCDRLVAYVEDRGGELHPQEVRRHVVDRLREHPGVVVPHWFVLCRSAPERLTEARAWRRRGVWREGDGKGRPHHPPATRAAHALHQAIAAYHPSCEADVGIDYIVAGGRAATAPAVVAALRTAGYTGLTPDDLLRPVSLGTLARQLRPSSP